MKVFLEAPRGITEPVTVTAGGIKSSAVTIDTESFLPMQIWVNGKALGPADWLSAAMAVLCGEQSVTVVRTNSLFRSISCPPVCVTAHLPEHGGTEMLSGINTFQTV